MRILYSLLIFILMVTVLACTSKKNMLTMSWIYNDDQDQQQQIENITEYGGTTEENLTGSHFIDLRKDGNFTSYLSRFDSGKWYFRENNLILVDYKKQLLELEVKKLEKKELVCLDRKRKKVYRFTGYENDFLTAAENPFSATNNRWRIKALEKESDAEIAARLKNHFLFWEKYFAWARQHKVKALDVLGTPSLLEMYGNGYRLEYFSEQPESWKRNFYDSADCWKAYEKIYYMMNRHKITGAEKENRYEGFENAFHQVVSWFDEK